MLSGKGFCAAVMESFVSCETQTGSIKFGDVLILTQELVFIPQVICIKEGEPWRVALSDAAISCARDTCIGLPDDLGLKMMFKCSLPRVIW